MSSGGAALAAALAVAVSAAMWALARWRCAGPRDLVSPADASRPASPHGPGPTTAIARRIDALMSDVALCLAPDGALHHVSASAAAILGTAPASLRAAATDGPAPDPLSLRATVGALSRLGHGEEATLRLRRGDGALIWVQARCHSVPDTSLRLLMLSDITRQRQAEQRLNEALDRLARLANEDALTGLANRASFLAGADRLIGAGQALAMLFIDLDRFRPINDVHGHHVGDAILRETGRRLALTLVDEPLVARLSADAFAALLRAPDGDTAVAERVREIIATLAEPIGIGAMTLDVGASVGIAVSPRDGTDAAALLRAASIAMTQARSASGGGYRFFEQRMTEELALAEELRSELRAAIAAHEILPFFQPLVRLRDGAVVGFELLARWNHPRHGLLPPARFLPLIEEAGLSAPMLAALLTQACRSARSWPDTIRLSVNISARELQDESLPEDLQTILEATGTAGSRIEIEVTENALIRDSRIARGVIDRLRAMGLTLALDDFGTGFSSLYHLRELPFDKIKIDKSFMAALTRDPRAARHVAAMIGLGQALGLSVTAEGIEDAGCMERLKALGCTFGQGYFFGHPMPAHEAARLLTDAARPVLAAE